MDPQRGPELLLLVILQVCEREMAKNHLEFSNVAPCLGVLFPKRIVLLFTRQCDLKIKSYK